MQNELWIELCYKLALLVITFLFYNVIAPMFKQWTEAKLSAQERTILEDAVKVAEQVLKDNEAKKKYAMEYADKRLKEIGINKTTKEIADDIERAVYSVKKDFIY